MFIELKRYFRTNRFKLIRVVRSDEKPDDGGLYVLPARIENLTTSLTGGGSYFSILRGYSLYIPNCIERVSLGHYRLNININAIRKIKRQNLERQTRQYITSDAPAEKRMPEWRQIKLRDYLDMYERKVNQSQTIGVIQEEIYGSMVDPLAGDTENSIQTGAITAFRWIIECRRVHRIMLRQLKALTDLEAVLRFNITKCPYPQWVDI